MTKLLRIVALTMLPCAGNAAEKPSEANPELRAELQRRVKEDQDARTKMIDWLKEHGPTDPAKLKEADNPFGRKMREIDEANTQWLKNVVAQRGWPGKSLVGEKGAHDAWLLVQHADRDREFQKKCLGLMKPLVTSGDVSKTDFAYLTDRVLIADGKKQLFGTQFRDVNGRMEPQPIEDEANVDRRRKEMGMDSLAEYRKAIEKMYQKK